MPRSPFGLDGQKAAALQAPVVFAPGAGRAGLKADTVGRLGHGPAAVDGKGRQGFGEVPRPIGNRRFLGGGWRLVVVVHVICSWRD